MFSGEIHGGNWYAVGGKSFLAQLFKDAGADYFLKDDDRSGGVTLDFETVYNQADEADYWRIVNSYPGIYTYKSLKDQDPRYADFRAFKEKGVIYCNMREKPFYESMPTEPEVATEHDRTFLHFTFGCQLFQLVVAVLYSQEFFIGFLLYPECKQLSGNIYL